MPFNRLDLARVASASTGAPAMWLYLSETEALADVLNSDYFGEVAPQLRVDDVMCCRLTDRNCWLRVLSVDPRLNQVVTEQTDFISPIDGSGQGLVNWRGNWRPDVYEKNDQVLDNGWLMIANTTTVDRPSPQPIGSPIYSLPEIPLWVEQANVSIVYSGQRWTFTSGGWINSIRVWAPEITPDTIYRITTVLDVPGKVIETSTIEGTNLNANGWTTIGIGSLLVLPGTSVLIVLSAVNSSATTNIAGDWLYQGPTQDVAPFAQNWTQDNQRTDFRIDKTDLASADRSAELEAVLPESNITVVQANDSGRTASYRVSDVVDSGTYMTYSTILLTETGGGVGDNEVTNISIDVPIPLATKYEELTGNWPTNDPSWATVEGYLAFTDIDDIQPGSELNAYGTDLLFNEGTISEDWDVAASSEGGGTPGFTPSEELAAFSLVDQDPVGLDTPVDITFGAAQGTPSDVIELSAGGLITFNKGAVYSVRFIFSVARTTTPLTAFLFIRSQINGVPFGNPITAVMSENQHTVPLEFTFTAFFPKGTTVQMEMYRDSAGIDNGGLSATPSTIGWGTSVSASVRINELS